MKIPTLSEEEKWRMMRETFVMNIQTSLGFIMEKLGQEGMKEYSELTAESYAQMLQAQNKDDAIGFAISEAVYRKNLWGSEIEVKVDSKEALLDIKKSEILMTAMRLVEKGQLRMSKEEFQRGCIEGYFRPRAEKLGLKLDVEYTDEGYRIKISKK